MTLQMQNEALQAILNILQPPQPQPQPQPQQYIPRPPKEAEQNELPPIKPVEQPKPL